MQTTVHKYLQYSKRIAIFGIIQWSVIAFISLILVLLSNVFNIVVDEFAVRIVNNIVTCSSTLAVAICSGYYAHSAYDNNLKQKLFSGIEPETSEEEATGNG